MMISGCAESGLRQNSEDTAEPESQAVEAKFRILHIMSYHSPWGWTDDQFAGFKDALGSLDIEYNVFQMDTKRNSILFFLNMIASKMVPFMKRMKKVIPYKPTIRAI